MSKYEFDLSVGIKEVLDADSAKNVENKIKKQKAELEQPIEIKVNKDDAEKKINKLIKASEKLNKELNDAVSSNKSFKEIDTLVKKHELLKKEIKGITSELDKNNKARKRSNEILRDTQKIIDSISVAQVNNPIEEAIKANNNKKKSSKIKLREFTQEEYDAYQEKYKKENDGNVESLEDTIDLIRQASQFGTKFAVDMETSCKRATTAVNRFFSMIDAKKYPALASWKDSILESVQNGYFSEVDKYNGMNTGAYSWGVEALDDNRYYVYLNFLDVVKDKEKEYSEYLKEEFKKRDEGLEKEDELITKIYQTYEKLNDLHKNEPNWDRNNEIQSIRERLKYYEQEKELLQDINNCKEELFNIPGKYRGQDAISIINTEQNDLRLGDYGNAKLKDNEKSIAFYTNELERAIKKQEKLNSMISEQKDEKIAVKDEEELKIIKKENGALEEKLELLQEISEQYANNISQRDRNRYEELNQKDMNSGLTSREEERYWELGEKISEADEQLEEFGKTYDKILLKLYGGKTIKILPDDSGLKKFDKIANEFYSGEYDGIEIEDVIFERAIENTNELTDATKELIKAKKELNNIVYHAGDLSNITKTLKSFPLGNVVPYGSPGVINSIFGGLTGLYTTEDVGQFWANEWDGAPISSIDLSQYKLFDAKDNDLAIKVNDFFTDLNATIYGYLEYFDYESGELAKTTDVKTTKELYSTLKEVFKSVSLDFDTFDAFIERSKSIVAGHDFADLELPSISEGIAKSGISKVLQGVSDDVLNADSFPTQLMKMLGFEGIDLRGTRYNGTYSGGTVIFDIRPESLKTINEKWSDVMSRNGYEISDEDLKREEKRRQLAFDTAKAYSKITEEASSTSNLLNDIADSIDVESKKTEEIVQLVDNYGAKLDSVNNKLMQGTKLLDKQGNILRLFHNSNNLFDKFTLDNVGTGQGSAWGPGIYLASNTNDYEYAGKYQTQWYANIKSPFIVNSMQGLTESFEGFDSDTISKLFAEYLAKDISSSTKEYLEKKLKSYGGQAYDGLGVLGKYKNQSANDVLKWLGYDSIVDGNQVNVFDPNNVFKATDVYNLQDIVYEKFEAIRKELWSQVDKRINEINAQIKKIKFSITDLNENDNLNNIEFLSLMNTKRDTLKSIAEHEVQFSTRIDNFNGENISSNERDYIESLKEDQALLPGLISQVDELTKKKEALTKQEQMLSSVLKYRQKQYIDLIQPTFDTSVLEQLNADIKENNLLISKSPTVVGISQPATPKGITIDTSSSSYISPYSEAEINSFLKGTSINSLLKEFNLSNDESIVNQFRKFASIIADEINNKKENKDNTNTSRLFDELSNKIIQSIMSSGTISLQNEKIYEDLYTYLKGIRIRYTDSDKKEFGDDWKDIIQKFGNGKNAILTKDSNAKTVNEMWDELSDLFPQFFDKENINEKNQLKEFLDVIQNLRNERNNKLKNIALPDETENYIFDKVAGISNEILSNVEKVNKAKEKQGQLTWEVTEKTKEQAEAEKRAAKEAEKAAKAKEKAAKERQDLLDSGAATEVSVEELVRRDMDEALAQLRAATDNKTTLINLEGVFSGEDLVDQFSSFAQKIAEQANLSVKSIEVKDDTAKVKLYNEELKVTVDQTYKLRSATEEAESAILELTKQSFKQDIKALNENNFDVEGFRARATAAVEKVRSSLHGLEYDLTNLDNAAKNISSKEDFNKFNNQLKATQDNIQAIKNATVSKSSMNQLANMQRDMKNANIELETMRIKLQKIGDIDGVADANKMIDDMTAALKQFNNAKDAQAQQKAYSDFSDARSSFKAQLEYLNAVKSLNNRNNGPNGPKPPDDNIRKWYESLLDTINKINSVKNNILKYQAKDGGSGLFSSYITQLQSDKQKLELELQSITQEINDALSGGYVQGKKIDIPWTNILSNDGGAVSSFLNDTKTQAALTTAEIEKFVAVLQKSQNIDVEAASKVAEQFKTIQNTYKQITSLNTLDTSGSLYQNVENVFAQIMQYKDTLSSDPTQWTPEQSANLQTLIRQFNEYGNILVQVGKKEAQYFTGKTKYAQDTTMSTLAEQTEKESDKIIAVREKLTKSANEFAKESGASGAIVTNFVQGANGIAKLDFSVLDQGTNSLRKFRMEMGSVTEGTFITETTINNSISKIQAAAKQLENVSSLLARLKLAGVNDSNANFTGLKEIQNKLSAEISKGDAADNNILEQLTKDAKITAAEIEKVYRKSIQLKEAILSGNATDLGKVELNGDVYSQMVDGIKKFASTQSEATLAIGGFNEKTGILKFTLTDTSGVVRTFEASLDSLTGQVGAQETGVKQLSSSWDNFKTRMHRAGRQLATALVGYNAFFKVVSEIRKGINYVKEVDLALTELKKVTDETEAAYAQFLNTASKTSGAIGSTLSDFTDATANFARLGYSMEESARMAETAIVYKNVADGLDSVDESTQSIISTMKAFGITSDDTMSIIDRFNEVKLSCLLIW